MSLVERIHELYDSARRNIKKAAQAGALVSSVIFGVGDFTFADQPKEDDKYIVGLHGYSQDWGRWSDLETAVKNRGYKVKGINLPNQGNNGWGQNKKAIDQDLANIPSGSKIHAFFAYSYGAPTWIRYFKENPLLIEQNPGATLFFIEPAVKMSLGEFFFSEPLRPLTQLYLFYQKRLLPSQTEKELTGNDEGKFLEETWKGFDSVAENMRRYNWRMGVIKLDSEWVDGKTIDEFVQKFREHGVKTDVHTPDEVMNKYSLRLEDAIDPLTLKLKEDKDVYIPDTFKEPPEKLKEDPDEFKDKPHKKPPIKFKDEIKEYLPIEGNTGYLKKEGRDTVKEKIPEHKKKRASHVWWSRIFRGALVDLTVEEIAPRSSQERGMILEPKDPRKQDVEKDDEEYKDDKKDHRGPNDGKGGKSNIAHQGNDIMKPYTQPPLPIGNPQIFQPGRNKLIEKVKRHAIQHATQHLPKQKNYGGVDLTNITLDTASNDDLKNADNNVYTSKYGGIIFSNLSLVYLTEGSQDNQRYLAYVFKATSGKKAINTENSTKLSLESLLNWITLPDEIFWVNLNPNEPQRIIDERLRQTDLGEILLKADLQLKKESARLTDPRTSKGKAYWNERGKENSKNKTERRLWIVPGDVEVYANDQEIYIQEAKMDVMLESEYLASQTSPKEKESEDANTFKTSILPEIAKAVNENEEFEELRQVFYARVLAQWYENKFPTGLLSRSGIIKGNKTWDPKKIFDDYVWSYKEGEYSFTETTQSGNNLQITHRFLGGVNFSNIKYTILRNGIPKTPQQSNIPQSDIPSDISRKIFGAMFDPLGSQEGNEFYWGGIVLLNK